MCFAVGLLDSCYVQLRDLTLTSNTLWTQLMTANQVDRWSFITLRWEQKKLFDMSLHASWHSDPYLLFLLMGFRFIQLPSVYLLSPRRWLSQKPIEKGEEVVWRMVAFIRIKTLFFLTIFRMLYLFQACVPVTLMQEYCLILDNGIAPYQQVPFALSLKLRNFISFLPHTFI